jgi:hypothetical protein
LILPHKDFCTKIRTLKDWLGAVSWSCLWTPDYTYAQFKDICAEKGVDKVLIKEIGGTISSLRKRKGMYLEDIKRAGESHAVRLRRLEADKLKRRMFGCLVDRNRRVPGVLSRCLPALAIIKPTASGRSEDVEDLEKDLADDID